MLWAGRRGCGIWRGSHQEYSWLYSHSYKEAQSCSLIIHTGHGHSPLHFVTSLQKPQIHFSIADRETDVPHILQTSFQRTVTSSQLGARFKQRYSNRVAGEQKGQGQPLCRWLAIGSHPTVSHSFMLNGRRCSLNAFCLRQIHHPFIINHIIPQCITAACFSKSLI